MSSATTKTIRIFFLLFSLLAVATPAVTAASDPNDEIVYRVNLGRADDVKLLLKQGAQANDTDDDGVPLLSLASERRDAEGLNVVKALVESGADINGKDDNGQTALFYAAKMGNVATVKYLLSKGIQYYAIDNRGNIARTIAFQAGHKDVVTVLDDFVKAQTEKTAEEYRKYNQAVEENYKKQQAAMQSVNKEAETAMRTAAAQAAAAQQAAETPAAAKGADEKKPAPQEQAAALKQREAEIKKLAAELSFSNCAFEYWYFCHGARQSTELSPEELTTAIESNKDQILSLQEKLIRQYQQPQAFVTKLSDTAKESIFKQLESMVSNSERHERGIGRMDDMQKRCQAVAQAWDIEGVAVPSPGDNASSGSGGGGIGPVSHTTSSPNGSAAPAPAKAAPAGAGAANTGATGRKPAARHPHLKLK